MRYGKIRWRAGARPVADDADRSGRLSNLARFHFPRATGARAALVAMIALAAAACTTDDTLTLARPQTVTVTSDPAKYAAIVVDGSNGRTLYAANASASRYPASLTKMMTLYMLFEAIDQGRVGRQTQIPISAYAAGRPPSKIGFKAGQSISVDAAIQALCVKSANDCLLYTSDAADE